MDNENICPICGEPTRCYMGNFRKDKLCGKHANMLKRGEILLNSDGLFEDSKSHEILNKDYVKEELKPEIASQTNTITKMNGDEFKCIACGKPTSSGHLFCVGCYKKFKDKELLVRISKCTDVEILDDSYEGKFHCEDGHVVKSKSEREIDNYLFRNGIPHAYEKAIPIDALEEHDLHPDFWLPNFKGKGDVYIEHWGFNSNNREYYKSKKYKINIYKEKGLTIVCTFEKDMEEPSASLKRKLDNIEFGKINFDDEE